MIPTHTTAVFTRIVERRYDDCRRTAVAVLRTASPIVTTDGIRLHVALRVHRWRRPIPMRLEVTPWTTYGDRTSFELLPLRRVRPSRRYVESGHRLLDDLVAALESSAERSPRRQMAWSASHISA
jgi:hypothetical protein